LIISPKKKGILFSHGIFLKEVISNTAGVSG
jgi:hypothetical protein